MPFLVPHPVALDSTSPIALASYAADILHLSGVGKVPGLGPSMKGDTRQLVSDNGFTLGESETITTGCGSVLIPPGASAQVQCAGGNNWVLLGVHTLDSLPCGAYIGEVRMFASPRPELGWAAMAGQSLTIADHQLLFFRLNPSIGAVSLASGGVFTCPSHGLQNTARVFLSGPATLPSPLSKHQHYYVVDVSANTFKLAETPGGSPISTSGTISSGIVVRETPHGISGEDHFLMPDARGRVIVCNAAPRGHTPEIRTPVGPLALDRATLGGAGGEGSHQITEEELPAGTVKQGGLQLAEGTDTAIDFATGGTPMNIIQPSLVLNAMMRVS